MTQATRGRTGDVNRARRIQSRTYLRQLRDEVPASVLVVFSLFNLSQNRDTSFLKKRGMHDLVGWIHGVFLNDIFSREEKINESVDVCV